VIAPDQTREIVRAFYRQIFRREPDPEGAKTYEDCIKQVGIVEGVRKILSDAFNSREYRQLLHTLPTSQVNSTYASYSDRLLNGRAVSHIASIGPYCLPSIVLKSNGLKRYSLPFDWLFSSARIFRDCLADDFAMFLDRRYYRSTTHVRGEPSADHEHYLTQYGVKYCFAHRDPTRNDDYEYFVRCVERFRRLLHGDDAKLFLFIARPDHDLSNNFSVLLKALENATTNFGLLCVEVADATGEPGMRSLAPIVTSGVHGLYRLTPSAYDHLGSVLPDKLDEWMILRLIYRYKLSLKDSP
jgi:hypothetical protein